MILVLPQHVPLFSLHEFQYISQVKAKVLPEVDQCLMLRVPKYNNIFDML